MLTQRIRNFHHDPLTVGDRKGMGVGDIIGPRNQTLGMRANLIDVPEPVRCNRTVIRYTDPIVSAYCSVGRRRKRYRYCLGSVALDRSRHKCAVIRVIAPQSDLQLDPVLPFKFITSGGVCRILQFGTIEIPVLENTRRVSGGIDGVKFIIFIGARPYFEFTPSGTVSIKRFVRQGTFIV